MKPRIKKIDGWWRVVPFGHRYHEVSITNTAQALEWCRRMNQQTKIAATFALLGIPQ